ncbi:hypothetical protein CBS147333_9086 [Penicillium roqueforti]|nr:hypothetical protein CBS147333_9086 [Penicillium roqueforti]KAI3189975.1 hypothetical protein CBS147311_9767 [Penicillium roqueforti]KAI3261434.1 hypothetical protein CBS147308_9714 [Penicillium roqueforti]KAI3281214.1 hypothetical protein DTO003C3_9021 [Penicillium roqueforti]
MAKQKEETPLVTGQREHRSDLDPVYRLRSDRSMLILGTCLWLFVRSCPPTAFEGTDNELRQVLEFRGLRLALKTGNTDRSLRTERHQEVGRITLLMFSPPWIHSPPGAHSLSLTYPPRGRRA